MSNGLAISSSGCLWKLHPLPCVCLPVCLCLCVVQLEKAEEQERLLEESRKTLEERRQKEASLRKKLRQTEVGHAWSKRVQRLIHKPMQTGSQCVLLPAPNALEGFAAHSHRNM